MNEALVCLIDGQPSHALAASDSAVLRGDGCFEAIRVYAGSPFRLADHFDRLHFSASALGLAVPERGLLEEWTAQVVAGRGDCVVRIVLTRGPAIPGAGGAGRCIVMSHPLPPALEALRLLPVAAPWHPAGRPWELAGVKSISYAPNLAASRRAATAGFDDAVLVGEGGVVLEGPTFSVGWVSGGVLRTPSLDLGILESITRRVVMELAPLEEVVAGIDDLLAADEVFAMSTLKEVTPVVAVGDRTVGPGPVTARLRQRVAEAVAETTVRQASLPAQPR